MKWLSKFVYVEQEDRVDGFSCLVIRLWPSHRRLTLGVALDSRFTDTQEAAWDSDGLTVNWSAGDSFTKEAPRE